MSPGLGSRAGVFRCRVGVGARGEGIKRSHSAAEDHRVILSDRPSGERPRRVPAPASTGSRAPVAPAADRPVPKALCEACGRPVAHLKSPTCLYCGAAVPAALRAGMVEPARTGIPAEVLVMLEPRPQEGAGRKLWLLRFVAISLASVVILVLVRIFSPKG